MYSEETKKQLALIGIDEDQIDILTERADYLQAKEQAERSKEYYDSDDFASEYVANCLMEDTHEVNRRIKGIVKDETGEQITTAKANEIQDYINANFDDFLIDMRNWYVGESCIDSVDFGEQEEQIGKSDEIDMAVIAAAYEDADYFINWSSYKPESPHSCIYAYYDISGTGKAVKLHMDKIAHLLAPQAEPEQE